MGRLQNWAKIILIAVIALIGTNLQAQTVTNTFTNTFTSTFTMPPIATNTPTPTLSLTGTRTMTPTGTFTPTPTPTRSPTPTQTATPTPTQTTTFTRTLTPTSTGSITFTRTHTSTFTPTFTNTMPVSVTNTLTRTYTPTQTFTPQVTTTSTFTRTRTHTYTNTFTPSPVVTTCRLMDDLEDGNLVTVNGGNWTAYTFGTALSTGVTLGSGANGTNFSAGFGGSGATVDGINGWGVAAAISPGVTDLSASLTGVSFWIRSSAPMNLKVGLVSQVQPDGDYWAADLVSTTTWTQVTVPLSAFSQSGWGVVTPLNYALSQVLGVGWEPQMIDGTQATVWVDEICLQSLGAQPTATWTPTITRTPTWTPTPGGAVPGWTVPVTQVVVACGCSSAVVNEVRRIQLDPFISYVVMRLTAHCGCSVTQIMQLRRNMGWDEIAVYYGVQWRDIVNEALVMYNTLPHENTPPDNFVRDAANDPNAVDPLPPATPVPTEQLVLLAPYQEVCP